MRIETWTDGQLVAVEEVPDPPDPPPTAEERLATLVAALADAQSLEEIRTAAAGIV